MLARMTGRGQGAGASVEMAKATDLEARLKQLKGLLDQGLISNGRTRKKRKVILSSVSANVRGFS